MPETVPEGETNREQILKATGDLAKFLLENASSVKRVGIAGSFARGKGKPSDIDLVIFVDGTTYEDVVYDEIFAGATEKHFYGLAGDKLNILEDLLKSVRASANGACIEPFFLPNSPTTDQITDYARRHRTLNPTLLQNLINDTQLYDLTNATFHKAEVYQEPIIMLINDACFNELKNIASSKSKHLWGEIVDRVRYRREMKGTKTAAKT